MTWDIGVETIFILLIWWKHWTMVKLWIIESHTHTVNTAYTSYYPISPSVCWLPEPSTEEGTEAKSNQIKWEGKQLNRGGPESQETGQGCRRETKGGGEGSHFMVIQTCKNIYKISWSQIFPPKNCTKIKQYTIKISQTNPDYLKYLE